MNRDGLIHRVGSYTGGGLWGAHTQGGLIQCTHLQHGVEAIHVWLGIPQHDYSEMEVGELGGHKVHLQGFA